MTTASGLLEVLLASLEVDDSPRLIDSTRGRARDVSGREFAGLARRAQRRLGRAGVERGSTVLFAVRRSVAAAAHLVALTLVGARVVLVDMREPAVLVRSKLERVKPQFVLTEPLLAFASRGYVRTLVGRWVQIPPIVDWAPVTVTTRSPVGASIPLITSAPEDPALVLFTSGTTDLPKAVVHTQRSLGAMFESLLQLMGEASGEVVYSDQFHSLLPALAAGATCVVGSPGAPSDKVTRLLKRHRVTTWFTTPSMINESIHLLSHGHLDRIVAGSAPVTPQLVHIVAKTLPDIEIVGVYAMTEATPVAVATGREILAHQGEGILLGTPVPGLVVTTDHDGEIVVEGERVASYLGESNRPIRTGDVGRLLDDGRLVLDGRAKTMIIVRGQNIYPELYEPLLAQIDGIGDVALVGLEDELGDEELWLVVDLCPHTDEESARRAISDSETGRSLPLQGVIFTDVVRSGRSNKIDRAALREEVRELRAPHRNAP